ncbi:MAG: hypothetical protein ACSLFB_06140, partial [Acidimicrobiales bacterium]
MLFRGFPATIAVTLCIGTAALSLIAARHLSDVGVDTASHAAAIDSDSDDAPAATATADSAAGSLAPAPLSLQIRGPEVPVIEPVGFAVPPV